MQKFRKVSKKDLDVLLNCYCVEKKATKKADKVKQWRVICVANTEPPTPMDNVLTAEDEEQLVQLSNKEINMSEKNLGR